MSWCVPKKEDDADRITRIAYNIELPMWLVQAPEMQALWREININII